MTKVINSYYQTLGVSEATPLSQIKAERKKLLAEIHPDRFDLSDERRFLAEEKSKEINQAFEAIKKDRAEIKLIAKAELQVKKELPRVRNTRKRLETVESKVVVRDGKVVMIKRKKPVKFGRLKDFRDSARDALLSTLENLEEKAKTISFPSLVKNQKNDEPNDKVVHIVEGNISIEPI